MNGKLMIFAVLAATSLTLNAYVMPRSLTVEMSGCPLGIEERAPRLSWKIDTDRQEVMQTAYHILVASSAEALAAGRGDVWNSGRVESDSSVYVPYRGIALEPMTRYWWKVRVETDKGDSPWSDVACWQTGIPGGEAAWGADWIGGKLDGDDQAVAVPARYLRRAFKADSMAVNHAVLYIAGLGLYEPHVNGHAASDNVMLQAPTRYDKRVLYNAHDVTSLIRPGRENVVGVVLGNGRYCPERMGSMKFFGFPRMIARLEIEYSDGHRQTVVSDPTWRLTDRGPIRANSEFDGEIYDSRMELEGWAAPGYDDSAWMNACCCGNPGGELHYQLNPSMAVKETVLSQSVTPIGGGRYVIDMGENMVGRLKIKIRGGHEAGDSVKVRFAETLNPDGTLYVTNLRSATPCDVYVCHGRGEETWYPTFTYHGFRYAEISGLRYEPSPNEFLGHVIYDDMPLTGSFECSDATINRVYANAMRGIRSNYRGMPTDCPQRDERLPWLGDRTTGAYGEAFPYGNHGLYAKWMDDIESCQTYDGGIPDICPDYWDVYSDNMTWPAAYFTVADMLYRQYGDSRPVIEHYDSMRSWIERMKRRYMNGWVIERDEYGDWCTPPESLELIHSADSTRITPKPVLATSHLYMILKLMERFAGIAGREGDVVRYGAEADSVKNAFNRRFYDAANGWYGNNTVTGNLLALRLGLVDDSERRRVTEAVRSKIVDTYDSHICVGVIGVQHIMRGLTENGLGDLAFRLASERSYPSWGYMADRGATTIWELWNGDTAAPDMNSGNHVMLLGDLLLWEYGMLAGINAAVVDGAGFGHVELRPVPVGGLSGVSASYESVYGRVASSWTMENGVFEWTFTIPANTRASVYVPGESTAREYGSGTYNIKY